MRDIKVTLSGSGFRFPTHVGALAAVIEKGYRVVEMSGTSGGAIVAAMYSAGVSIEKLVDITYNTNFDPMLEYSPMAIFNHSYCDGKKLYAFIQSKVGKDTTFGKLKVKLHIAASDIVGSRPYIFGKKDENVAQAVLASSSVPFLYPAVKYNNMFLYDGGICTNTPIELLSDDDNILKLGVKLTSDIDTSSPKSSMDILGRAAVLLFENNDRGHIETARLKGALFSFVNTGTIGTFDSKMSLQTRELLFDFGYKKTLEVLTVYENETMNTRGLVDYYSINKQLYG